MHEVELAKNMKYKLKLTLIKHKSILKIKTMNHEPISNIIISRQFQIIDNKI